MRMGKKTLRLYISVVYLLGFIVRTSHRLRPAYYPYKVLTLFIVNDVYVLSYYFFKFVAPARPGSFKEIYDFFCTNIQHVIDSMILHGKN